jgi:CspA family cold shock protein
MQFGKVKWFSALRGYGFIEVDDGAGVFVHHAAICMDGFRTLKEGQLVSFELIDGPRGRAAGDVRIVIAGHGGIVPMASVNRRCGNA